MKREELIDKLRRAYEMEEVMASLLMDTVSKILPSITMGDDKHGRVSELLLSIQQDTLSHKKVVSELIDRLSKESRDVI